jgi:cytochrome c oxidase cbb3-type subunit 1
MGLVLTMAGLIQGTMWMSGTEWLDSLVVMRPYWMIRTISGMSMDLGITLLVYNLMRTALAGYKNRQTNVVLAELKVAS